jgi:D-psicose/D-tagatose/L-ribulose 3-epimerase
VPVVEATDPMDLDGFIALQVHQVGKREDPLYISWRNIRVKDLGRHAWRPLLGTKALAGFRTAGAGAWKVEDGAIVGTIGRADRSAGLLLFEKPLGDFAARARVRLGAGNAGLYVGALPAETAAGARGLQIDLDAGPGPTVGAGGLYETGGRGWLTRNPVAAADPKNKGAAAWKPGEWVDLMVTAHGGEVASYVGGYKVASLKDLAREKDGLLALELAPAQDARLEVKDLAVLSEAIPPPVANYPIGWCIRAKGSAPDDARAAGFEYVELALQDVLGLPDDEFEKAAERFRTLGIPALSGYNLFPDDLKLVGPDADRARQDAHLQRALPRVAKLGVKYIIFNSGPARRAPDGYAPDKAFRDLVALSKRLAAAARKHKLSVLIIPLRSTDTNLVTKVGEALDLVRAVGAANFALAVDYSFMSIEKEDPSVLAKAGKQLRHVQISNPNGRGYPMSSDEADYAALFAVLKQIRYQGGLSVHARTDNFYADAPRALRFLRLSAQDLAAPAPRRAAAATPAP